MGLHLFSYLVYYPLVMKNPSATLVTNLTDTLRECFAFPSTTNKALVIFDTRSELSQQLTAGYRAVLPEAEFIDFDQADPQVLIARLIGGEGEHPLQAGDLAVLIQSSSFRLNEFRLRIELFKKGLKVIEHVHLGRMSTPQEIDTYIDALAYDKAYLHTTAKKIKELLQSAKTVTLVSGEGGRLVYEGPFEDPKMNIGDYSGGVNMGGQFPIGEVFTEPVDLTKVHGTLEVHAFGGQDFTVKTAQPNILLTVENGMIAGVERSTPDFDAVIAEVEAEEKLCLRELGFGLNRAFTKERTVTDVGTYERICGTHFSLGGKHTIYPKEGFHRKHSRFHVDAFPDTTEVWIDEKKIFANGEYLA